MNGLTELYSRLVSAWKASTPASKIMVSLSAVVTIATMLGVAVWSSQPDYKLLREGISPVATAEIVSLLQASGIPHQMNYSGTGVLVPTTRWNEANVAISSIESKESSSSGFDSFLLSSRPDHASSMHARELSLEKSLQSLRAIKSADVHLAVPKKSPFRSQQASASASVIVEAAPNRIITNEIANSIIRSVAKAVEGLDPKNVILMDAQGGLIGGAHGDPASIRREYVADIESSLAFKAQDILATVLGPNRSVVRVTAEVDDFLDKLTKKQQIHTEEKARITERITTVDQKGLPMAAGVAGTSSNIPNSSLPASSDRSISGKTETNETSYDYPRTTEEIREIGGRITRISVSATVDISSAEDENATEPSEPLLTQAQVEGIIKSSVGFNEVRGDQIEVVLTKFSAPTDELNSDTEATVSVEEKWSFYSELARNSSLGLTAVVALLMTTMVLSKLKPIDIGVQAESAKQKAALASLANRVEANPEAVSKILAAWIGSQDEAPQQKAA